MGRCGVVLAEPVAKRSIMTGVLAITWGLTLLITAALDLLAKPQVAPWRSRPAGSIALHLASVTGLYLLFFALSGRASFTLICTTGLFGALVVVNNAKFSALREPVVFSDLALFVQSIRHPRLYFPYLSWTQLLAVVPGILFFVLTFSLDSKLNFVPIWLLGLGWAALFWFQVWLARGLALTLDPARDQAQHGFFCVFVAYLLNGLSLRERDQVQVQFTASPYANIGIKTSVKSNRDADAAPDVVVVQSESFFDIRKLGLKLMPDVLKNFDALKQSGICAGELVVPAWGANTMRTEHAFLSGLSNSALRYAGFYPYAFVSRQTPAMPQAFRAQGYRCLTVHPYATDFFLRDKVFPRLGFDEFVDEAQFNGALRAGPYVSDEAVTDYLIRRLDQSTSQPQFMFVITMENHGPFHLEKATDSEVGALYERPNGLAIDDLTVYLRHLANASKMLGRLQDFLVQRQRKTLLCFYGDHVPSMGHVYDTLKASPERSDYLLWANYETDQVHRLALEAKCLTPELLGLELARVAGVVKRV